MPMFKLKDGTIISADMPFTQDDVNYFNVRGLEQAKRDQLGITEVADAPVVDERFFWSNGQPKDLAPLQVQQILAIKATAGSLIGKYDYQSVREFQGGKAMSATIKTFCAAVRAYSNTVETEVNALKDVPSLVAWVAQPFTWPVDPNAPPPPTEG